MVLSIVTLAACQLLMQAGFGLDCKLRAGAAAKHFQVEPAQSLLLGDSISDVHAARAAGFSIVCVSYGYNHGQDIRTANPDAVIDSFTELRSIFKKAA